MIKAYIVHGWSGSPREPMLAWIADELRQKGYEVIAPEMPNPDVPTIGPWVNALQAVAEGADHESLFIGHSVGCQTILRYLETLPEGVLVGRVMLIAPWMTLQNLDEDESPSIARPWIETPIDFEKVRSHATDFTCFFSTNDPYVPLEENEKLCKQYLHAQTIVFENRGHFTEVDGVGSLPELLGMIL